MGRTWSVYIADDKLNERIEEKLDGDRYHNQAHLFSTAVKRLLDNEDPDKLV